MLRIKNRSLPNGKFFSLEVPENEILFLQGPNGAGKSLLLKSVANLIKGNSEEFIYQDKILNEWNYPSFRSQVMYVATVAYFPTEGTVEDFLAIPFTLEVYTGRKPAIDTEFWLNKWSMKGVLLRQLSSGQKQSLGVLRALSLGPKLLLLDEPTSHLDTSRTSEIETLILDWQKKTQGSVIIVGHDLDQPRRFGGKILKIEDAWV
jgi:ABC-type iron transport system FetAB ATPase subunit